MHCVVESINHVYQWSQKHSPSLHRSKGHVELDRFVIIPNNTAFRDLTEAALVRLGYSKDTAAASKGLVVLKNWLPLDLDTIAEDPVLTVNDVLGELTTLATLRILVFRYALNIMVVRVFVLFSELICSIEVLVVYTIFIIIYRLQGSEEPFF